MKRRLLTDDRDKRVLIEDLSSANHRLAIYFDEMSEVPDCVQVKSNRLGIITPPYDYETLASWWYYGGWRLVTPPVLDLETLDTFRTDESMVAAVMREAGVTLLIDSFHDDIEWNVFEDV